jgi:aspartyl-tRNA synthetase
VDVDDVIAVNERLLKEGCKNAIGIEIALPLPRMTWAEAMARYGSDKPDTRFAMELIDVSAVVANSAFVVFAGALEKGGSVRGLNAKGQAEMPRKKIDALVDFAKGYGAKGLAYLAIQADGGYKSSFTKFMTDAELTELVNAMAGEPGDLLLFAADKDDLVFSVLGALRLELAGQMGLIDEDTFHFLWITEFPLLQYSEEENRYVAVHHPFTMPMDEDLHLLDCGEKSLGDIRAKAYDIVLNGTELGGGSVRIYQNEIQEKMFAILGMSHEEANDRFGFLLDAFKYGVPPHAGLAYGLDRLVMLLTKAESIREVIAFPKIKDASCLLTNAPDVVNEKQLAELHISLKLMKD